MKQIDFENQIIPLKHKIFRFAKRILGVKLDAEDITQEVFLKLWSKKEGLSQYKSVEALAMTMTRNSCLDQIKAKKNKAVELNSDSAISNHTPLKHTELDDSMNLMNTVLEKLPEQQKMIIQLRDIEGYDFEEISSIMDMTVNAIRVNLSRARQKIKEELNKVFDYELRTD